MTRTAMLVRCNVVDEAARIRFEANRERRTISSYVLNIAIRAVTADDRLFSRPDHPWNELMSRRLPIAAGQRTAILVRCAYTEADRIREAARRRDVQINTFILHTLKNTRKQKQPPSSHVNAF